MKNKLQIILVYCLPALAALAIALGSYYHRAMSVADTIHFYQRAVQQAAPGNEIKEKLLDKMPDEKTRQLIADFKRKSIEQRVELNGGTAKARFGMAYIKGVVFKVWLKNSVFIVGIVLLPFLLFAVLLAISNRLPQSPAERLASASRNVIMKFAVATIMSIGWIYILNPDGRGVGTIENYLISVDLTQEESLPLYIRPLTLAPAVAAFLGWYLHMLSYFFGKIVHHDVVSPYVYNHLFKKFLFVYGVSMVLPATRIVPDAQMSVAMFLLGYFPLAAFSLIKDQAAKLTGKQQNEGYLTMIPGISRWQILRLEEEGVESMADLAGSDAGKLKRDIPGMSCLLDYWIDVARLYAIVGEERFLALRDRCTTASGFIKLCESSEFKTFFIEHKLGDVDEVRDNLTAVFTCR